MICLPSIKDELCRTDPGLILLSEIASSLSYTIFAIAVNHIPNGIFSGISPKLLEVVENDHTGILKSTTAFKIACIRKNPATVVADHCSQGIFRP